MERPPHPMRQFIGSPDAGQNAMRIRIDVNRNHCHRYAICEQEAPDVFRLSADGRLRYQAAPEATQRDAVRQAARVCPMQAIVIEESR